MARQEQREKPMRDTMPSTLTGRYRTLSTRVPFRTVSGNQPIQMKIVRALVDMQDAFQSVISALEELKQEVAN